MELLDRYLQAIKRHLPAKRQDDIIAELRANLEAQLEEREAELGRPLTQTEAEDWLRKIGSPIQVAARYRPQQYLIGPGLFPVYLFVLRLAAVWAMIIYAIVNIIQIAVHLSGHFPTQDAAVQAIFESFAGALARAPFTVLSVATWVTLIFASIEFAVAHDVVKLPPGACLPPDWNPRDLPPVQSGPNDGAKPRTYAHAVAEVIFGFLLLAWMILIPWHPFLLLGPGAYAVRSLPYTLGPVCWTFFWWIVGLNVVQLGWRCIDLLRDRYQGPRFAQHAAVKLLGIIPMVILLTTKDRAYVVLKNAAVGQAPFDLPLDRINDGIFKGLLAIFIIAAAQLLWDLWKAGFNEWKMRSGGMR